MADDAEKDALEGTHAAATGENSGPRAEPGGNVPRSGPLGQTPEQLEAQIAQLTGDDTGLQDDLFDVDEELGSFSLVEATRNRISTSRGAGRPKGAQNKRNGEMAALLQRMGFNHPMLNLATLANSDVQDVREMIGGKNAGQKALQMILEANKVLLPYFESKLPDRIDVHQTAEVRHMMLIGQLPGGDDVQTGSINVFTGLPNVDEKSE